MISRGKQFETLNGLRGVAAMVVVAFHWFGGLTNGYLAVDFFYVLSGFVIAYAYGNRLRNGLSLRGFLAIRLIRLYPLYLFGTVLSTLVLERDEFRLNRKGIPKRPRVRFKILAGDGRPV